MYESIRIQNFRGLKDLTIENLGRVNLLVGANNVGKTSVLEAIWLLQGPTEPARTLDLAQGRSGASQEVFGPESVWYPLFGRLETDTPLVVSGRTTDGIDETLVVEHEADTSMVVLAPGQRRTRSEALNLRFDSTATNRTSETRMTFDSDGEFAGPNRPSPNRASAILGGGEQLSSEQLAVAFTRADDTGQVLTILQALAVTEPRAEGLSLGFSEVEERPYVRLRIRGIDKPVPAELIGAGSRRLLDMLCTMASVPDGCFLVDEVGEGFYHRAMESMWRQVDEASSRASVQVFATTHSLECVEAALQAFEGSHQDDLRVIRLERVEGEVRAVDIEYDQVATLFDLALEFR